MLSELRLKNFKAFGDKEQKAPMSKITLIYGPNSGGKSSIIQALLMLKQSLVGEWSRDSGRRELMPRGEYVDLGGFSALIFKHDIKRELGIGVTFNNSSSTKSGVNLNLIAIEDSSVLSEVGYQILDGNEVLLDAKLKYEPGTNSWDTPQLKQSFRTTNCIESLNSMVAQLTRDGVQRVAFQTRSCEAMEKLESTHTLVSHRTLGH